MFNKTKSNMVGKCAEQLVMSLNFFSDAVNKMNWYAVSSQREMIFNLCVRNLLILLGFFVRFDFICNQVMNIDFLVCCIHACY